MYIDFQWNVIRICCINFFNFQYLLLLWPLYSSIWHNNSPDVTYHPIGERLECVLTVYGPLFHPNLHCHINFMFPLIILFVFIVFNFLVQKIPGQIFMSRKTSMWVTPLPLRSIVMRSRENSLLWKEDSENHYSTSFSRWNWLRYNKVILKLDYYCWKVDFWSLIWWISLHSETIHIWSRRSLFTWIFRYQFPWIYS